MKLYPIAGPEITAQDVLAVTDAVKNDWFTNANQSIYKFEKAFANYIGRKYAVALSSGTSAIHLALATLNLQPDDEVIVPNSAWIACSAPIEYVGAKAVFVDVDLNSWCLDAKAFAETITDKTKAVIVVDLYGNMPDWDEILNISKKHNIFVIEDGAQAIGSRYLGKLAGNFGDVGAFSFHASKTITTGEGGMLVTDNKNIHEKVLSMQNHGRPFNDKDFFNSEIAFKYKMSSLQAALGLSQLQRLDAILKKKKSIFMRYYKNFENFKKSENLTGVLLNPITSRVDNSYWMVTMILDDIYKITIPELRAELSKCGIDTRPFFHPLSKLPAYQRKLQNNQVIAKPSPNAYYLGNRGLNLPSTVILQNEDIDEISNVIKDILWQTI